MKKVSKINILKHVLIGSGLLIILIILIQLFFSYISIANFGSLFLIGGSYFLLNGNIYKSTISYVFADMMWSLLSFSNGDILGAIVILFSVLVGLIVINNMNDGKFVKNLEKGK